MGVGLVIGRGVAASADTMRLSIPREINVDGGAGGDKDADAMAAACRLALLKHRHTSRQQLKRGIMMASRSTCRSTDVGAGAPHPPCRDRTFVIVAMSRTFLIGDIGGTNTRLQLIRSGASGNDSDELVANHKYRSRDYPSLVAIVQTFLKANVKSAADHPHSGCLALAGPVRDNACHITNLSWPTCDGAVISRDCGIGVVRIINDFVAAGYGVLALPKHQLKPIHTSKSADSRRHEAAPKAIIGAGTGLGEAYATPAASGEYEVYPSEGGHADFAPRNDLEMDVMRSIRDTLKLKRVSVERLVSGTGIANVYDALSKLRPKEVSTEVTAALSAPKADAAAVIASFAKSRRCNICVSAIELFIDLYGAEAGNHALKTLPFDGVYIAGGVAEKLLWAMIDGDRFYKAFINKGRIGPILADIPIYLAVGAEVGLDGAKVVAKRLIKGGAAKKLTSRL